MSEYTSLKMNNCHQASIVITMAQVLLDSEVAAEETLRSSASIRLLGYESLMRQRDIGTITPNHLQQLLCHSRWTQSDASIESKSIDLSATLPPTRVIAVLSKEHIGEKQVQQCFITIELLYQQIWDYMRHRCYDGEVASLATKIAYILHSTTSKDLQTKTTDTEAYKRVLEEATTAIKLLIVRD